MRLIDADALFQSYLGTDKQADLIKYEEDKLKAGGNGDFFPGFYTAVMIFRDLINEAPTIGGWISVKERLPEDVHDYLVVTDERAVHVAVFTGSRWYLALNGEFIRDGEVTHYGKFIRDGEVTHWMPLPEPPEEMKGEEK